MSLPMQFLGGGGAAIASYDYFDMVKLTGYKDFNLIVGASGSYIFSDNLNLKSEEEFTANTGIVDDDASYANYSGALIRKIDLQFNTPVNIKGDLFLNFRIGVDNSNAVLSQYYGAADIYYYNGTTETLLGSGNGKEYNFNTAILSSGAVILKINLPSTHFKSGDYLRIYEKIFLSGGYQVKGENVYLYHNNEDTNAINKIYIPFKIDI